jgi:hypothetical protein
MIEEVSNSKLHLIFHALSSVGLALWAAGCSPAQDGESPSSPPVQLNVSFLRQTGAAPAPFSVQVTATRDGQAVQGLLPRVTAAQAASISAVTQTGPSEYQASVQPAGFGPLAVSVSAGGTTVVRTAVVLTTYGTGVIRQPMAIPGDLVNSDGYEDGVTIIPDGQFLFIQYGPFHFSGLSLISSICSSALLSIGYDLNGCSGRANSSLVFSTVGPSTGPARPGFPSQGINGNGTLKHLPSVVVGGVANGILGFPTAFYGFRRQPDGSFGEPFKVAFDDERGLNGPFGLSFRPNTNGTTDFAVAWNNYFNDLGDDKADIYTGNMTLGQAHSLGEVVYSGETFTSISPTVSPAPFSSHVGTQGNPYLELDPATGQVRSIWTDDEASTHDLSVYRLTSGAYPNGTWVRDTLPAVINTAGSESQPTFVDGRLYLNRDVKIVYHEHRSQNGSCGGGYSHADCWGPEVLLLAGSGGSSPGDVFGVGEPTVATVAGQRLLYFVYVRSRENLNVSGLPDFDLDAGFVEIE